MNSFGVVCLKSGNFVWFGDVLPKPVILAPKSEMSPLQTLGMAPGFKWLVNDHDDIRYMNICVSACASTSYVTSNVVLPKGVVA
jgi:hypothetical protein